MAKKTKTTKKTTQKPIKKKSDTVHVKTGRGYKIVVKKGSPFHKSAKKHGIALDLGSKARKMTSKTDPLSVRNYSKRKKK